ncbi:MAG TPA: serine/threonine-protein kinase [Ktedonobacteraceae bacterium]|nr:serine/threonine-protein kinase [Ktedonobacteraceae bacterium]
MQSTASTWFCATCGAANEVGESVCFSCNQARGGYTNAPVADSVELLHGRYRLLTQVGVGGFGEVYKALDTQRNERVVAIKQINLRGLSPQKTIEATDTFNRELHILSPLKHSSLPRIYEHFTDPDHWYLVMEFLEGETLERYLESRLKQRSYGSANTPGLLPSEEIFSLAFQLCDVLDYLHERQPPIIFRDIKPANIMRSGSGHVCLIDFGIARFFTPGRAKDTTPLGSPGYAASEQYGRAQTTARSDLYSLGALLHYLLTGDDPSETPFQFAPLPRSNPPLAGMQQLEALITRMVDVDSSQRPASAREVKEELQGIASLVEESAMPRLWSPPPGLPPDPEAEGALQQQVQIQVQKHRSTTRRKFLKRSLIGGSVVIFGTGIIGALLTSLASGNASQSIGQDSGTFRIQQGVTNMALSPNGRLAAFVNSGTDVQNGSGSIYNEIHIYQIEQGSVSNVLSESPGNIGRVINTLAWSPDNKHLAVGFTDGTITVWNISAGVAESTFSGSNSTIENMAWSPDGLLIASSGVGEALRICKTDGTVVLKYAGNSVSEIRFLAWSPDSKRIVTQYDSLNAQPAQTFLQVWDVQTSKTLFTFGDATTIQVAWSPDGNRIASVSTDYNVNLFNASNGGLLQSYPIHGDSSADSFWPVQLLWSPDSRYLALDNSDYTIQIWDTRNDATGNFPARTGRSRTMLWQPDDQLFIIDASQNTRIIDPGGI